MRRQEPVRGRRDELDVRRHAAEVAIGAGATAPRWLRHTPLWMAGGLLQLHARLCTLEGAAAALCTEHVAAIGALVGALERGALTPSQVDECRESVEFVASRLAEHPPALDSLESLTAENVYPDLPCPDR